MNRQQFKMLKDALDNEDIQFDKLKEFIEDLARSHDISPMFQRLADAYLIGDQDSILLEAHHVRANSRFIQWGRMIESQYFIEAY
ncbi:MAG: hypothetical protein WC688_07330 [Parachlamydiales bacterium]|jgi:hypothetical protein